MSSPFPLLDQSINANPADQNLLQGATFQLSFSRLPYIQFFIQKINIPGIITNPQTQPTPFINAPLPANKMTYERLSITFAVDEALWSWTSLHDWLKGLTIPESFQEYKNLSMQQRIQMQSSTPQYSDCILTVLTNKNNPIISFHFSEVFPVSLTGIDFNVQADATQIITATGEFAFTNYDVNRQV